MIYRKDALKKLSTPEQLNKRIVVAPIYAWVAIFAAIILVVAVTIWGTTTKIPHTVDLKGILLRNDDVEIQYSHYEGFIDWVVTEDMDIEEGTTIAFITDKEGVVNPIKSKDDGVVFRLNKNKGQYVNLGEDICWIRPQFDLNHAIALFTMPLTTSKLINDSSYTMICPTYLDPNEYGYMYGAVELNNKIFISQSKWLEELETKAFKESLNSSEEILASCYIYSDLESANGLSWTKEKGKTVPIDDETPVDVYIVIDYHTPFEELFGHFD